MEHSLQLIASRVATTEAGYVGAAHAGSNTVVAVSPLGIDWLSFRWRPISAVAQMARRLDFPSAVACFATHSRDARGGMLARAGDAGAAAAARLGTRKRH